MKKRQEQNYCIIINRELKEYSFDPDGTKEPPPGWRREGMSQRDIVLSNYIYQPFVWPGDVTRHRGKDEKRMEE